MDERFNEDLETEVNNEDPEIAGEDTDIEEEFEFEYDEEGNIIIPDIVNYDDEKESEKADSSRQTAPDVRASDERDKRIEGLERELKRYRAQVKDTLSKLGMEAEDDIGGLVRLAAEADGITEEEYLQKRKEDENRAEADLILKRTRYEELKKADLAAIQAVYPEAKQYDDVERFPNFKRFGELRDKGLTPIEAYVATHPEKVGESAAAAAKQRSLNGTKQHLRSAVPRRSSDNSIKMSRSTLEYWRGIFPEKSDKEIAALYKQTAKE